MSNVWLVASRNGEVICPFCLGRSEIKDDRGAEDSSDLYEEEVQ